MNNETQMQVYGGIVCVLLHSMGVRAKIDSAIPLPVSYLPEYIAVYTRLGQSYYPALHMLVIVKILNTLAWPFMWSKVDGNQKVVKALCILE